MARGKNDQKVRAILKNKQKVDHLAAWLLASDLPVAESIRKRLRLPQSRTLAPVAARVLQRYLFDPNTNVVQLAETARDYPLPPLPR